MVIIPYSPREWQYKLHESTKRWIVLVIHRRGGKSTAGLNHLQRDALRIPQSRFAYIAPTYKQAKNIAWDLIKYYARPIPGVEFNEAELTVKYPNGSRLTLYGADNPDSLRGIALWGVVFDEYSQQPSNIFSEIIRPALSDHEGYAIWIGTPKGKNQLYDLYQKGKITKNWLSMLLTVEDTQIIPQLELDDARKVMTDDEFNQEYMCSFDAAIKGAYYSKELELARSENRITKVPYDQMLKVHTWWDLGVGDSTVIGFFQVYGTQWRVIDYYEASGEGLPHYVNVLKSKGYNYGEHFAPHDIRVRELGSGKSRLEIAQELGLDFQIAPNIAIDDGINALRMRFNTLWIDEDCKLLIESLSQYRKEWNDKMGEYNSRPLHDWTSHAADMMRYWAVTNFQSDIPREREEYLYQVRERKLTNQAR
ncbi:MAG: terminase large subunit domain-containing protein [Pyrinomonadaceae bacterium]